MNNHEPDFSIEKLVRSEDEAIKFIQWRQVLK